MANHSLLPFLYLRPLTMQEKINQSYDPVLPNIVLQRGVYRHNILAIRLAACISSTLFYLSCLVTYYPDEF